MKTHTATIQTIDGDKDMTILDAKDQNCMELARELYEMRRFMVNVCCGVEIDKNVLECD